MSSREKIVLIGAGSAMFTVGLVADMLRTGQAIDLALVDIDPQALETAERLAARMIAARKAPIHLRAATDRRAVLPGASVVICTIGVGGRRAWEQDVFIPRKYGIRVPVGDTVGPGGSSRALRMIPAMVAIANDVLDLCPEALFFNYGNPMAPVCRAVRKATGANMIGLCHGVFDMARYLAEKIGVGPEELDFTAVGINHLTWFTQVRAGGQDAMPRLRQVAEQIVSRSPAADAPGAQAQTDAGPFESSLDNPFSWRLLLDFGSIPSALDRHVTEFFPRFFGDGQYYGKTLGVDEFSFEGTIAAGDHIYAEMRDLALSDAPLNDEFFAHMGGEHEQVIEIIQAIRANHSKLFHANLPNTGQVPNLPEGAIIESPAVPRGGSLHALVQPPLPSALAGVLATRYQWVEAIVEAALEQSRDKFVQALVLDGYVRSLEQARALADELLAAQSSYLNWDATS